MMLVNQTTYNLTERDTLEMFMCLSATMYPFLMFSYITRVSSTPPTY